MAEVVEIDFLTVANHVEAVNGLLYMSGGGWTDHHRVIQPGGPPPVSHFGVGISIRVPWNETNRPHRLVVRVEDDDATVVIASVDSQLTVGRPPQLPPGADQHAVIGINIDTIFPRTGGYRVVAQAGEGGATKSWEFRVHDVPAPGGAFMPPR